MKFLKSGIRILKFIITALLAILLICNIYTIWQRNMKGNINPTILGYSSAIVISGSMEPAIQVDDFIIVKEQDDYAIEDIIMFRENSHLVTHRIVEETNEGFRTQGDANNTQDTNPVVIDSIEGKVVCVIPHAGAFIRMLHTPMGMCIVVFSLLLILFLNERSARYEE